MIGGILNSSVAALLAARQSTSVAPVRSSTLAAPTSVNSAASGLATDTVSFSGASNNLRSIGDSVVSVARFSNTLAVADTSLQKIGDLLGQVQVALGDASQPTTVRQSTIDTTIGQIDQIVGRTRFDGHALLDGTYTTRLSGQTITLPSASSTSLGTDRSGGDALASLSSDGLNDLASGRANEAQQVVIRASDQVDATRASLSTVQNTAIDSAMTPIHAALHDDSPGSATSTPGAFAQTAALLVRAATVLRPALAGTAVGNPHSPSILSILTLSAA